MKVRADFLPLNRPSIGNAEIESVVACLKSGWITTGPQCRTFEGKFCELTGAARAVTVTSATAGMHLLLMAMGIGPGDEVITPSMTFASTVNMIAMLGASPVFVDVEYDTLNIDAGLVEQAVSARTKAIIPVHFAGVPADMDRITDIADRHNVAVIEDAAHAIGTYYKGIHAGGFGREAILSFHPIKNITTGEGGLITTSNEQLENRIRLLRFHGIERDAWKRYGKGGNPDYDIMQPGFKYNMPDILAALGVAQLARMKELNGRRGEIVDIYMNGLKNIDGLELPGVPVYDHIHSHHLFIVKVISMQRESFMEKLSEYNIGYGLHFPATHLLHYIRKKQGSEKTALPETERVAGAIISLPLFPDMKDDDAYYVCDAIRDILK